MKKRIASMILALAVSGCSNLTPTERAILDDAAQRAINKGLDKLGPATPGTPVKAAK